MRTVRDPQTGRPLRRLTVAACTQQTDATGSCGSYQRPATLTGGRHAVALDEQQPAQWLLRIEANGYLPFVADPMRVVENDQVVDVLLRRDVSGPAG